MIEVYPPETPAVRPLEMHPARIDGRDVIVVRDPLGIMEGTAILAAHPLLLVFFQLANGRTSCSQMAEVVTRATGTIIRAEVFESITKQLDEALLLLTPRFRDAYNRKRESFLNEPIRPCQVFRAEGMDRLEMIKSLSDLLRAHWSAPGGPPPELALPPSSVLGILAPHIDYERGGAGYAWAYRALKEHGIKAHTYVVLGTSHKPLAHRFVATRKDFDTPFGVVKTNRGLLEELQAEFQGELFADEFAHANEHTIELQAVYLRHKFGETECPQIVPILVGSFEEMLYDGRQPADNAEISSFCEALKRVLERHGDSVGLIGGVDFSHCGPHFGDLELNDEERECQIETLDRGALAAIESGDPNAFFEYFRPNENSQKVCSIATIYVALAAIRDRAVPRVLSYHQANTPDKTCLVSFASVAFLKKDALKDQPKIVIVSG
ncbi:MAG: AmmeMemoRadiSam system protein B [Candidatus Sumerlaeaceae bacterium]|nr:AmmeMemoRadiSam system protein B [Candidatus Sumerlaeaceae bacterium]